MKRCGFWLKSPGKLCGPVLVAVFLFAVFSLFATARLYAQKAVSIPEEIEWTWEVRPPDPDAKLPNVLLLGDSITRNYFLEVRKDLSGKANVYLMAASTSIGDPRLPRQIQEFAALERVRFLVIHCNNGMHGWKYTEAQYQAAFPAYLREVRRLLQPNGRIVWATITPVRSDATNGATNSRIDARNAIADAQVKAAAIAIDDQHALMMQHRDLYQDSVHFNPSGAAIQGEQVAASIQSALAAASH